VFKQLSVLLISTRTVTVAMSLISILALGQGSDSASFRASPTLAPKEKGCAYSMYDKKLAIDIGIGYCRWFEKAKVENENLAKHSKTLGIGFTQHANVAYLFKGGSGIGLHYDIFRSQASTHTVPVVTTGNTVELINLKSSIQLTSYGVGYCFGHSFKNKKKNEFAGVFAEILAVQNKYVREDFELFINSSKYRNYSIYGECYSFLLLLQGDLKITRNIGIFVGTSLIGGQIKKLLLNDAGYIYTWQATKGNSKNITRISGAMGLRFAFGGRS
jgi:hypothetical protein